MFLPPERPLWSQYLSEVCLLWHPIVYSSLSRSTIPWNCFACLSLILFEGQDFVLFTPVSSGRTPRLAASLHSPSTISPSWGWVLRATLSPSYSCHFVSLPGYPAGKSTLLYPKLSSSLLRPSCSYNLPIFAVSGAWKWKVLMDSSSSLSSNDAMTIAYLHKVSCPCLSISAVTFLLRLPLLWPQQPQGPPDQSDLFSSPLRNFQRLPIAYREEEKEGEESTH